MPNEPHIATLTPVKELPDEALLAIAKIVRACADLEDVLNLWISKLAGTGQAKAAVLLGRSNISTKIAVAEGLANLSGTKSLRLHKAAFEDNISKLLTCRNAVAHGVCIGRDEEGSYGFMTNTTVSYEGIDLRRRADAYTVEELQEVARVGAMRVEFMDELLELQPLRDKRQWQHVPVLRVDRPQDKKASKPKPPRPA